VLKVLSDLLQKHQIQKQILAAHIFQANKKPLSPAMLNLLINKGLYPKTTPQQAIEKQIVDFLNSKGINVPKNLFEQETNNDANPEETYKVNQMLSQDAKKVFKLFQNPFTNDVNEPKDVFWSQEQIYIREAMKQTAKFGGFMAIIGESGAGKSTLRRDLIDTCERETQHASAKITFIQPRAIDKTNLTAAMICDAIIQDVSLEKPKRGLEAKSRQVEKVLRESAQTGNSHVLLIEEAHDLNIHTLKYLKRFWELDFGHRKLLGIILIGQPELKLMLNEDKNYMAREVIRRCEVVELLPLDNEIENYLTLKFNRIGRKYSDFFAPDAADAMRAALTERHQKKNISMSYPLTINNLVVRCLNLGADLGISPINADLIKQAA
jgi:type II secretory pathway predicted ATPase ExeA